MVDATVFIFLAEKARFFKLIFCNVNHQNVISFTGLKSVFLNMHRNEFSGISIIYTTKTCFKLFNFGSGLLMFSLKLAILMVIIMRGLVLYGLIIRNGKSYLFFIFFSCLISFSVCPN